MVLTIHADDLSSFLLNLKLISQKYNLKFNGKKYGIFLLNSRYDYSQPKILNFPVIKFYNNLSCRIDFKGNILNQINQIIKV
jgi:hypothetical protein